jgi:DNA-binding MurR/RpiR family transcriptional regulator
MSIEALLLEKKVRLTAAQKRVVNFIIEHYEEAIFLTVSRLARKASVSEATVVRLAQALGFDGYPAMQRMLRENLQNRLSTVTRIQETIKRAHHNGNIFVKIMQEDIQNLTQTLHNLPQEAFQRAVEDIRSARRVFVAGLRGAHAPAIILVMYLRFLKKEANLIVPGFGDVWNEILGLGSDDLVIGISLPRYTRLTVEILEYAHDKGAKVGAISDSPLSPLAINADWVLPVSSRIDSFIESFTAAVSVVNALLTAVSVLEPAETVKALKEREDLWRAKNIYMSPSLKSEGKPGTRT